MTRAEHLQWAKDRAIELLDMGDSSQAFASMCSDLNKHDGLREHPGIMIGVGLQTTLGGLDGEKLRGWILGFN